MPDPTPPSQPPLAIPDSLRIQLADFQRRLWRIKILESVAAGLIGLLFSFLLVFGLDRAFATPPVLRLAILLAGTSLFAGFAPYWLHRWIWKHRRETQLARLIARRYPGLGDRLLGVIELQTQTGQADTLSPRLRAAAMEAVAAETGRRKLQDALPPQWHRRWGLAALALAAITAAAFSLAPRAALNALQRWAMPLSPTERYTFAKLEAPPTYLAVPYGEAFDLTLRLSAQSEQRPAQAHGRYGNQSEISAKRENLSYSFTFPGQQEPGTLSFRIGDLRHSIRVEPLQRPSTERITATIRPPAYLGQEPRTTDLSSGVVSAVIGSSVELALTMNRPLAEASFGPLSPTQNPSSLEPNAEIPQPAPDFPALAGNLTIQANLATTPSLDISSQAYEIPLAWTDTHGLEGNPGFRIRIDPIRDAPPSTYLQGIDRQKVLLAEETIEFEILAEDDFGLRHSGIEWAGEFTRPTDESPARGELTLAEGAPDVRRLTTPVAFSPEAYGITPQKLQIRAFTEDYFPDRGRIHSEPITLFILTRDEHAQMLKNLFDRNISELEDAARRELDLFEENQRLERLDGEDLQTEENRRRLDAQEQGEAENTRRMEDLTQRMEELLKDAVRNGEIDKDTLQKMAESLKSLQELSREDMPEVREKLDDARQTDNTPEQSEQDVADAVEKQREVVEKMNEAIEKANDANRQFEAGTFVNRLKKAASEQNGIAAALIDGFTQLLGLRPNSLDPRESRRLAETSAQQSDTASDVRWIQEDLGHYFTRSENPAFREIFEEMRDKQIDVGLEEIRSRLATNHSYLATEGAKKWAEQLTEWAGRLEKANQQNNGEGGEGVAPNAEDEDFEFMLRVMQMIQKQQDLRARTRSLEQLLRSLQPAPAP
jgi:hypothetical protein